MMAWIGKKWCVFVLVSVVVIVFATFSNKHVGELIQEPLERLKPCPKDYCEDIVGARGLIRISDNQTEKVEGEIEVAGLKPNTAYLVSFHNKVIPFAGDGTACIPKPPWVFNPWGHLCYVDIINFATDSTGSAKKKFTFPLPSSPYLVEVIVKCVVDKYKHVLSLDSLSFNVASTWPIVIIIQLIAAIAALLGVVIGLINASLGLIKAKQEKAEREKAKPVP